MDDADKARYHGGLHSERYDIFFNGFVYIVRVFNTITVCEIDSKGSVVELVIKLII
jgi:hypothetical protein